MISASCVDLEFTSLCKMIRKYTVSYTYILSHSQTVSSLIPRLYLVSFPDCILSHSQIVSSLIPRPNGNGTTQSGNEIMWYIVAFLNLKSIIDKSRFHGS